MAITNINHGSDRSLCRPALTCSSHRWCTGFLQHTGPQSVPLQPGCHARGLQGIVYRTQESMLEGGNGPEKMDWGLFSGCLSNSGPVSKGGSQLPQEANPI